MKNILNNLKPYWKSVLVILLLLVVQAWCDLSLPSYTSDIIDVGIQNSGIEYILPEKITKEEYQLAAVLMTEEEKALWQSAYTEDGAVLKRTKEKEKLEALDESLMIPIVLNYQMKAVAVDEFKSMLYQSTGGMQGIDEAAFMDTDIQTIGEMMGIQVETFTARKENAEGEYVDTECIDLRTFLLSLAEKGVLNDAQLLDMRTQAQAMFDTMGSTMVKSMGVYYAAECAEEAGVDIHAVQKRYLWIEGLKMVGIALLMGLVTIGVSYIGSRVGAGVGRDLRSRMFQRVMSFSNTEMDKFQTASLITRTTNDVQQIQMVTAILLRMLAYAPILGIGGIIKVIDTGAGMGWIIILALLVILGFVSVLMAIAMPKFKLMQKLVDGVNLISREILTGLNVIRAFGREQEEEKRFDEENVKLTKTTLFTNRVMAVMMPGMMVIMYCLTIGIVWVASHKIDQGVMQVGQMTAFITYAMMIVMAFLMLTMMSVMLPRAAVAAGRIDEVLHTESSIKEAENPIEKTEGKGVLEFRHVHFRYPEACEDAIFDVDFKAEPGKVTAIIGSTGCGKSTLVNLIPRLYDVSQGEILLDGENINALSMQELRRQIGFVPQKGILFSGTIASNLRFGNKDASMEKVEEAARIAQAEEFIQEKHDKYESSIAQGGSNVSGGQKQRLAIARAIVKEPAVYVFDDSFSALDLKTDKKLRSELAQVTRDKTVIIVAQRISTILHADQILVLDEGRIVGKGTHEELMASCDEYVQIAKSQLSDEELGLKDKEEGTENGK